jgi:hypothetical protein
MDNIANITGKFLIKGEFCSFEPYGSGHIHETYLLTILSGKDFSRYILQKFNNSVFREPEKVLENIKKITAHLKNRSSNQNEIISLSMIPACDGNYWYQDEQNNYWRCFDFIENSKTLNWVQNEEQAYEGAKAFGSFSRALSDFEPSELNITIPHFHDIQVRLHNLDKALSSDKLNRKSVAETEIRQISACKYLASEYLSVYPDLPVHATHNDTKINNVLFDYNTGKALCVIDLDTVMPGTLLSDFGDMVRTFTNSADEDEKDTDRVFFRLGIFKAMVKGFLEETAEMMHPAEKNNLILGAKILIYMQAIRFLTDFLEGDIYYKTDYKEHNLIRTRNQLKLLNSILEHEKEAQEFTKFVIKSTK